MFQGKKNRERKSLEANAPNTAPTNVCRKKHSTRNNDDEQILKGEKKRINTSENQPRNSVDTRGTSIRFADAMDKRSWYPKCFNGNEDLEDLRP